MIYIYYYIHIYIYVNVLITEQLNNKKHLNKL